MKLIFLDIDGTLVSPGTNVPPDSALAAIRAAQQVGHKVFLCSGRNYDMLRPLLQYGFDGVVASGGGYILCGDEVVYDCPMTPRQQETMLRLLAEQGVYRTLECLDATFCDPGVADLMMEASGGDSEQKRWRVALEKRLGFRPASEFDGRPVYKLVVMCRRPEQLQPARDALEGEFRFLVRSGGPMGLTGGEIINRQFHKGLGVERVARHYGVPVSDTVGFGDSMNDLEMIETAGFSVCMANGSPELKALSDLVCPRVEEDGLARAFSMLGLTGEPTLKNLALPTVFASERIRFVHVSESLVPDYLTMVNDRENVQRFIGPLHDPYSVEKETGWVRGKLAENALVFSLLEKATGAFIGNIELMDPTETQAEMGVALTAARQGQGFGTEAIRALLDYARDRLGLSRVTLRVFPDNARAIRVYETCGFRQYDRTDTQICMAISLGAGT